MNVNLKKVYGKRFKFKLDRKQMTEDRAIEQDKIPTGEEWYQNLLCQYGEISLDGGSGLMWICQGETNSKGKLITHSKSMAIYLCQDYLQIITNFVKCDNEAIVYFDIKDIETVFKYAKPRRKRQFTDEQKKEMAERVKSYQFQKKEG